MRPAAFLVVLFAALANAQGPGKDGVSREQAVVRLNSDLANLQDVRANGGILSIRECLTTNNRGAQRPEECGPFDRVAADLSLAAGQPRHFPPQGLSFTLVNALAGRELEPGALSFLANALVDAVAIANRSAEARVFVSDSGAFRDSVVRSYVALEALGVDSDRATRLIGNFVRSAESLSRPRDFVPIPPAYR
jgi:hypothetical protein